MITCHVDTQILVHQLGNETESKLKQHYAYHINSNKNLILQSLSPPQQSSLTTVSTPALGRSVLDQWDGMYVYIGKGQSLLQSRVINTASV